MPTKFLFDRFNKNSKLNALIWQDQSFSYGWFYKEIKNVNKLFKQYEIFQGSVVLLEGDFSPKGVCLFLALIQNKCIVIPLTSSLDNKTKKDFTIIARPEYIISISKEDTVSVKKTNNDNKGFNNFYNILRKKSRPGLVLFSSGSTGKSKAAVHDFSHLLTKFKVIRHQLCTLSFLLYDHIGGINTLFYTLSNGGCMVTVKDRNPEEILSAIEKYRVELLPTSPTFLNLVLISEAYKRYDISSLKTISYGTEPMPQSTLKRFATLYPKIKLLQTYGLSEVGILRSKSKSSDSLWMKIGGEDFKTRVINNILHIKAKSAMLGYLNAPSPFTEDGWFNTGDYVEVEDGFIKIYGRKSDIINVGGQKVYPAEVESIIQEMEEVSEVTVYKEKNPILGNVVCSVITPKKKVNEDQLILDIIKYCQKNMQRYMIPIKIEIVSFKQHSKRFKKIRNKLNYI
jgi:acyl-CoA synthetase (AMP-forming)/AMP-acid ligase II